MQILQEQKSANRSLATAPALLYLLHPCSLVTPSAFGTRHKSFYSVLIVLYYPEMKERIIPEIMEYQNLEGNCNFPPGRTLLYSPES
jgi:hypothetical protein